MKDNLKKSGVMAKAFVLVALITLFLTSCSKTGTCESCGQNEKLNEYVRENGTVEYLCDDCYRMAKFVGY